MPGGTPPQPEEDFLTEIERYLDKRKFIRSIGKEPEDIAQTERYFEQYILRNQPNFADKSALRILLSEDGLEIFKNSYYLFFRVLKVLVVVFFVLSLISGAMIVVNAVNGEVEEPDPKKPTPHLFSRLSIGNLFDDKETRDRRSDMAFKHIRETLRRREKAKADEGEQAESESETQSEQATDEGTAQEEDREESGQEKQTEEEQAEVIDIPLSPKEKKLFGVYKLLVGLDVAMCLVLFLALVCLFFYINSLRTPVDTSEGVGSQDGPRTRESVTSGEASLSTASSRPFSMRHFSFFRDAKSSIKNYSLQIDVTEPWDFEEQNRDRLVYANEAFFKRPKTPNASSKESARPDGLKHLLRHSRSADDYWDFFTDNLGVQLRSLRFVYDFRGSLENFSSAAESLTRRAHFRRQLQRRQSGRASSQASPDQHHKLKDCLDRMTEDVLVHAQTAKRRLGVDSIERIEFDDLRGFKIIKVFMSFYSLRDKHKVAAYLSNVSIPNPSDPSRAPGPRSP